MNDNTFARINCPQDPPRHLRPIYGNLALKDAIKFAASK